MKIRTQLVLLVLATIAPIAILAVATTARLFELQRESYEQFLRSDKSTGYVSGLEKTLRSVFPIRDFAGTAELDFVHYELEDPKYDTTECRQRGITYAAPMKVTLRLIVFEVDSETDTRSVLDIKEQDVYMGDMPLMTENGTFFVNGTERVIVSQMHRSPGVLFDHDRGKTHSSGKFLFAARVIPYRGSWLDFEFDAKDIVNVRIDRKRKLPVTALLHALGLSSEEILNTFYNRLTYVRGKNGWQIPYNAEAWRGQKPNHDVVDADNGEVIFKAHEKITPRKANAAAKDGLKNLIIPTEEIFGRLSMPLRSNPLARGSSFKIRSASPTNWSRTAAVFSDTASNPLAGSGFTPVVCGSVSATCPPRPAPRSTTKPRCSDTLRTRTSTAPCILSPALSFSTTRRFSSSPMRPARRSVITRFLSNVQKLNRAATSSGPRGKSIPSASRTPRPIMCRRGSYPKRPRCPGPDPGVMPGSTGSKSPQHELGSSASIFGFLAALSGVSLRSPNGKSPSPSSIRKTMRRSFAVANSSAVCSGRCDSVAMMG